MSSSLKVDWCSYRAAKYAVENWHYSKVLPYGKLVKIGVWENGRYVGAVIYSMGSNKNIGQPYGLDIFEVCELTRVAFREHDFQLSQIVSRSLNMLKGQSEGLRLVVSYSDTEQGHLGILYQASNWIYVGEVNTAPFYFVNGRWMKQRTASLILGSVVGTKQKSGFIKHKYLYPLDRGMRRQIKKLAQPYPRAEEVSKVIRSTSS